jgi:hypothetical protein
MTHFEGEGDDSGDDRSGRHQADAQETADIERLAEASVGDGRLHRRQIPCRRSLRRVRRVNVLLTAPNRVVRSVNISNP